MSDDRDLESIYRKLSGNPMLYLPANPAAPRPAAPSQPGPKIGVRLAYADVFGGRGDLKDYYQTIRSLPVRGTIAVLAGISSTLFWAGPDGLTNAGLEIEARFAAPAVRNRLAEARAGGMPAVLFEPIAALLAMCHVFAFGDPALDVPEDEALRRRIGSLFLYANQVLDSRAPETIADDLDIARTLVPAWDLANPGDFAYTMSRTSAILPALNGKLAGQPLKAGNLEIGDFRAIVFAVISWIKKNAGGAVLPGWFSRLELLRDFPRAQPALDKLIADYSLDVDQFREAFGGQAASEQDFAQRIEEARFLNARPGLSCSIKAFYDHPLLRLDADRVAVLDPALLSLLLTRGLYWKVFDSLRGRKREDFKAAWGGCFETYGAAMLRYFFPAASNRLWTNVNHGDGEVDAILDYGSYAVLFELKSALLAEPAKRGGEREALKADIDKRYVRDDNGPRAVVQLARACRAARDSKLGLANASARLYPVIVTDEVCASAPGFNRYLHERFREEAPPAETAPLTVMSIVELEELLPYLDTGALAFDTLLNSRFTTSDDVNPILSVHQAIYQANFGKPMIRNDYLLSTSKAF